MQQAVRTQRPQAFYPVKTAVLPVCREMNLSIYLRNAGTKAYQLYRSAEMQWKPGDLERLAEADIATVYIDSGEYARFQEELRSSYEQIVHDESLPVSRRFGVLNEVVRGVLHENFRWKNLPRAVEQAGKLAEHVVDLIQHDDFAAAELGRVLHYDYCTFTHSANVAYYCVLLARSLGQTDRSVLSRIAAGGLLHDIGKVDLPEQIIRKRGPLTPEEYEIIQRHANLGLINLGKRPEVDFGQLMMAYQHHERLNGTGYPVRLEAQEIHEWARICAVADVYDALTSHRPYRRRLSSRAALEFMSSRAGAGLDQEFLKCWQTTICKS